jgi:hypothetical protein
MRQVASDSYDKLAVVNSLIIISVEDAEQVLDVFLRDFKLQFKHCSHEFVKV